jgi:hypothetical protein
MQTTRDFRTRLIAPFEGRVVVVVVVVVVVAIVNGTAVSIGNSSEDDSDDVLDNEAVDEGHCFCLS